MPDRPRSTVEMQDFPGLITDADPRQIPPGSAEEQINIQSIRPGQMEVRPGFRVVSFDS